MGVTPVIGRLFSANEQKVNAARAIVISDHFRRRVYGGDANVLGLTLKLDGDVYSIVGALPPDFRFPGKTDFWVPLGIFPDETSRSGHNYAAIGRLRPGITLASAQAEMSAIAARLTAAYPESNRNTGAAVVPLHTELSRTARPSLIILLAAVAGVLLIACANVGNLMLAQAVGRQREMAVRSALGAERWRIVRQLLAEGALLAVFGGLLGVLVASWIKDVFTTLSPPGLLETDGARIGAAVLMFSVAISAVSVILFGLAPAFAASRVDLNSALKQGRGRALTGSGEGRLRSALVVAEIALSMALAIAAGLTARSLIALERVPPGYDSHNLLVMDFSVPGATETEQMKSIATYEELLRRARAKPGVVAAAATRMLPLGGRNSDGSFAIDGAAFKITEDIYAGFNIAGPDYFRTMRIPLLMGREFTAADRYSAPPVCIISEALAKRYFPGRDPLGHTLRTGYALEQPWMKIVGVVADVRNRALQTAPRPEIYMPFMQYPIAAPDLTVLVRSERDPRAYIAALRRDLASLEPEVPVEFDTMENVRARSIGSPRFRAALLGSFALLALALAIIGVYAVMSFVIGRRTSEMGLRIALGAERIGIFRLAIARAARLGALGIIVGLAIAFAVTRGMSSLLYGVTINDPLTYAGVALLLLAAALAAGIGPARRAMSVDPIVALRDE
jgi:putative ABC transport system permease protein